MSEWVDAIAPGVAVEARSTRAFEFRARASLLGGTAFLEYAAARGSACFPGDRPYVALGIVLDGAIDFRRGKRTRLLARRDAHLLWPNAPGEVVPDGRAHVLGIALDPERLEGYRAETGAARRAPSPDWVNSRSVAGRRLSGYLDRLSRDLRRSTSLLHSPIATSEAEDTLARLLVDACHPPTETVASHPIGARAEELLVEQLTRPVSLAEVARSLDTSVRTLSRTFRERRGMGPIAFLRRRRLEAARHDLFVAEPDAVTVTEIALRYGFTHFGRFAVDYHRSFGERPSKTLAA